MTSEPRGSLGWPAGTWLRVGEVAGTLRTSRQTVYRWFEAGLPSLSVGGTRRILAEDLAAFLDAHRVEGR